MKLLAPLAFLLVRIGDRVGADRGLDRGLEIGDARILPMQRRVRMSARVKQAEQVRVHAALPSSKRGRRIYAVVLMGRLTASRAT